LKTSPLVQRAPEVDTPTLVRLIRRISHWGLNSMCLWLTHLSELTSLAQAENISLIQEACRDSSLSIDNIYIDFLSSNIFLPDAALPNEKIWSKIGQFAGALGAEVIEMVSPSISRSEGALTWKNSGLEELLLTNVSWEKIWEEFLAVMKLYSTLAKKWRLKLAIEPRPREMLSNSDALLRLFDKVPSESLGAIVDISHMYIAREIPAVSIRKLNDRIFSVHLSDNDGVTEWHWPPGQGKIDWLPVMKTLMKVGYSGPISLDVSGMDLEQEVIEAKQFMEKILLGVSENRVPKYP
jgi:sugar phosphate isomerase/epimerase